jgi:aldose sugar dehydrogenase
VPVLAGGYLFRFDLTKNRQPIASNPRLADLSAHNIAKHDGHVGTDIQTGPRGNLFVVSTSSGSLYEDLSRAPE